MRIPRLPARPWIAAAAVVAAAAILVATGVGKTHATEPANQQVEEKAPGGTAVGTPLSVILEFDVPSYRTNAAQQRGQAEEVNRQN